MQRLGLGLADRGGTGVLAHRRDVDGLRAVAVLVILAFHLDLAGFSGGFVGVDVFFVISGYVILRSILPDIESGRFSFADFIARRIRRILPALMAVLAATLAAGFLLLSPTELELLAQSALATVASGANIYFHDQTGYFASAAHTRPLLHMWSLGVEEQFYLIVPLALAALTRRHGIPAAKALIVIALGSFVYCLVATAIDEKHAFYMPMARFWEIAAGGGIAVVERRWGLQARRANVVGGLGILAIAASVLLLDSEAGGQRWVVIAVLGAACVIAAGGLGDGLAAAALSTRPMVAIGRMSFSIYLVHWPLIVFWKLCTMRPLAPQEQALIAAITVVLAALLFLLVEKPLRAGSRQLGNRAALAGIGTATAVVAAIGTTFAIDSGAAWRLQPAASEVIAELRKAIADRPSCRKAETNAFLSVCLWNPNAGNGVDFAIVGDSHAAALAPELALLLGDAGQKSGALLSRSGCQMVSGMLAVGVPDKKCAEFASASLAWIARERPRVVVIASRWAVLASDVRAPFDLMKGATALLDLERHREPITLGDAMMRMIERVRESGARVIVVGPVPEIDYDVPRVLVRSLHWGRAIPRVLRADFDLRQRHVMEALANVGNMGGVTVVYPHKVLCDETTCTVAEGPKPLYVDAHHLSPFGAMRVSAYAMSLINGIGEKLKRAEAMPGPMGHE